MRLKEGISLEVILENAEQLMNEGYPEKQAFAIAFSVISKSSKTTPEGLWEIAKAGRRPTYQEGCTKI